jgi:hypothetical protein
MPRIIVQAESGDIREAPVLLTERVRPSDFESDHFSSQLIERVGWAVLDAEDTERERTSIR